SRFSGRAKDLARIVTALKLACFPPTPTHILVNVCPLRAPFPVPAASYVAIIPETIFMTTTAAPLHTDKETNAWESQRARFDLAAQKLNLDEGMTRRYTAELIEFIGPEKDVPAPDVNTNEQVMAWMMDTYSMHMRQTVTAVVTGKPINIGGSRGRREATGRGVMIVCDDACKK